MVNQEPEPAVLDMQIDRVFADVRNAIEAMGWLDEGEKNYFAEQQGRYRFTLHYLKEKTRPGQILLDVGSHALHFGMVARSLELEVWGADIERFACDPVIQKRQTRFGIRDIRVCDLSRVDLPYEDAFFDVLSFSETLEHLNFNPLPVIMEFHRVLKPGGLVVVTTPNALRLGKRLSFLAGRSVFADLETLCKGDAYSVHFREYSLRELCNLLEWGGFVIVQRQTRYLYPSAGVRKLAKRTIETLIPSLAGNLFVVGQK